MGSDSFYNIANLSKTPSFLRDLIESNIKSLLNKKLSLFCKYERILKKRR